MSSDYEMLCYGHNSIYEDNYLDENYKKRQFKVKYSIPKKGVNEETGILLLIAGYGATSDSKVYKKMRRQFADKYNLVTLQCDYFGYEFMQYDLGDISIKTTDLNILKSNVSSEVFNKIYFNNNFNIEEYLKANLKSPHELAVLNVLNEEKANLNDMGIMQALDNIVATLNIIEKLISEKLTFNTNKVIIMGYSHGSYLGYVCNGICRGLYTHIMDNSAWIYPVYYYKSPRCGIKEVDNSKLYIIYKYLLEDLNLIIKPFDLRDLYGNFKNKCKIVVYHGDDDHLISSELKYWSLKDVDNILFNFIKRENLDNDVFTSTGHGVGADFIKLFHKFYNEYCVNEAINTSVLFEDNIELEPGLILTYKKGIPELIKTKENLVSNI